MIERSMQECQIQVSVPRRPKLTSMDNIERTNDYSHDEFLLENMRKLNVGGK